MDLKTLPKDSSLLHPKWVLACVLSAVYPAWKTQGGTWASLAAFLRTQSRNGLDIDASALKKYAYPKEAVSHQRARAIIDRVECAGLGGSIATEAIVQLEAWAAMSIAHQIDEATIDENSLQRKRKVFPSKYKAGRHPLVRFIYNRRKARKRNLAALNTMLRRLYDESIYKTYEIFLFAVAQMIEKLPAREAFRDDDGIGDLHEWLDSHSAVSDEVVIPSDKSKKERLRIINLHRRIRKKLESLVEPGHENRGEIFFIVQTMIFKWNVSWG